MNTSIQLTDTASLTAALLSVRPSRIQFDWGTDDWVLWIEDLSIAGTLLDQMAEVIDRVGFAVELQTGWDHREEVDTFLPAVWLPSPSARRYRPLARYPCRCRRAVYEYHSIAGTGLRNCLRQSDVDRLGSFFTMPLIINYINALHQRPKPQRTA